MLSVLMLQLMATMLMLLVPLQQLLAIMHKHSVLELKQQAYVLTYSVLMQLQLLITALQSVTKLMHPLQTPLH
jgi:hypothetical protein